MKMVPLFAMLLGLLACDATKLRTLSETQRFSLQTQSTNAAPAAPVHLRALEKDTTLLLSWLQKLQTKLSPGQLMLLEITGIAATLSLLLAGLVKFAAVGNRPQKEKVTNHLVEQIKEALEKEKSVLLDGEDTRVLEEKDAGSPEPCDGGVANLPLKLQAQLIHAGLSGDACCYAGIKALLQKPQKIRKAVTFKADLEEVEDFDPEYNEVSKPAPEQCCLQAGHPNFTGIWKCVKAEGSIEELFADMGMSYMRRKASAAFAHGVGAVTREFEHTGDHVKMTQKIFDENILEWDINGEEREVQGKFQKYLHTSYWDPNNALVLVTEGKDLHKEKPKSWTKTRQFFLDEDRIMVETSGGDGHVASWTFQRLMNA